MLRVRVKVASSNLASPTVASFGGTSRIDTDG